MFFSRGFVNFDLDYMMFDYKDFNNVTTGAQIGEEPAYSFDAIVFRAYLSLWF